MVYTHFIICSYSISNLKNSLITASYINQPNLIPTPTDFTIHPLFNDLSFNTVVQCVVSIQYFQFYLP